MWGRGWDEGGVDGWWVGVVGRSRGGVGGWGRGWVDGGKGREGEE